MEPGYITMTQRQSKNQQKGGIVAHPTQNIPSAKICWKISHLHFFWDQESILLIDYLPKGQPSMWSVALLCW
jgi:hypothetical protein